MGQRPRFIGARSLWTLCLRRPTFAVRQKQANGLRRGTFVTRQKYPKTRIRAAALMYPMGSQTSSVQKHSGYRVSPRITSFSGPQGPSSGQTSCFSLPSAMKAHSFRCPSSPHETRPLRGLGFRGVPMCKVWLSNAPACANLRTVEERPLPPRVFGPPTQAQWNNAEANRISDTKADWPSHNASDSPSRNSRILSFTNRTELPRKNGGSLGGEKCEPASIFSP